MIFKSIGPHAQQASLKEAVFHSLAKDGSLFMPIEIPSLNYEGIEGLRGKNISEIASIVLSPYLCPDIPKLKLDLLLKDALSFEIPLVQLDDNKWVLELFHGPTCAFKDVGARVMSRVISELNNNKKLTILVATSGDTGSAVASGFHGVPGIQVVICYPNNKISDVQEKQITSWGDNIYPIAVEGDFDDCQALVKQAFNDEKLRKDISISSANSINVARMLPQMVYYFYAISKMEHDQQILFSVPSGNLGNLCAGLIAENMGLKVHNFIAASNSNTTFTDYLANGVYTAKPGIATISNAMDVGDPSNFTRIMHLFKSNHAQIREKIKGGSFSDQETLEAMKTIYHKVNYTADPHSAIAINALYNPNLLTNKQIGIALATAHPAKFEKAAQGIYPLKIPSQMKDLSNEKKNHLLITNSYQEYERIIRSV